MMDMKHKVSELDGALLDAAVAKAIGAGYPTLICSKLGDEVELP
jgi:hypothetical protein